MTAYEVRISDWSSDVCSSDLEADVAGAPHVGAAAELGRIGLAATRGIAAAHRQHAHLAAVLLAEEGERAGLDRLFRRHEAGLDLGIGADAVVGRKSVVRGKSVSVRLDIGGRRNNKKKNN